MYTRTLSVGRFYIVAFITALCAATTASAQVARSWVGGSGDWFIASNWSPSGVPDPADSVTISSGAPVANAPVSIANLTLNAPLSGSGTVTITGQFVWAGGSLDGAGSTIVATGASMTVTNNAVLLRSGRRLENHGIATLSQVVYIANPSVFVNAADGTIMLLTDADAFGDAISRGSSISLPDAEFVNEGTIVKPGSARTAIGAGVHFTNSGTVDIQAGSFWINAGGASSGSVTMDPGSTLEIRGFFDFPSGEGLSGSGTLNARGKTVFGPGTFHPTGPVLLAGKNTINDDWSPQFGTLTISSGTVVVNGAFTYPELEITTTSWTQNGPMSLGSLTCTVYGMSVNATATIAHLKLLNGAGLGGTTGTTTVQQSLT